MVGAHVLRELIRDNPGCSCARIANMFLERTGARVDRSTVSRYRSRVERPGQIGESDGVDRGLVVNGHDLQEYHAIILEAVIRSGVPPGAARESEEYADGLVALYEAAEDFDPGTAGAFAAYAAGRIRRAIHRGKEERKVKVKGKSGRVLNFSEIGDEDFDIAGLIDESGEIR